MQLRYSKTAKIWDISKLSQYTEDYSKTADFIVNRFDERGWKGLGEKQLVTLDKVKSIVELSY